MTSAVCRACLSKGVKVKSLFAFGVIFGKKLSLKDVLLSCANLQISYKDGFPQFVCLTCIHQIEKAYSFRMMCEKNQETLKEQVKKNIQCHVNVMLEDNIAEDNVRNEHTEDSIADDTHNEQNDDEEIKQADSLSENTVSPIKQNTNVPCLIAKPKSQQSTSEKRYAVKQYGRFVCQFCKNSYKLKPSLELHIIRNHSSIPKLDPVTLICNICKKKCQSADHYKRHMNFHRTGKEYHCDECGRDFSQQRTFVCHTYSHTGERPVLCTECGKTFKTNVDLGIHMRTHLNVFPYTCKTCGEKFRYSSRFTIHKRRHVGEKPFECPFCDKKFICSDRLTVHKRTHTGEKPFPCKICGKAFARSSALKVHSQTHTGEKPHICTICDRGFSQAHCLRSHLKLHKKVGTTMVRGENDHQIEDKIKVEHEVMIEEMQEIDGVV